MTVKEMGACSGNGVGLFQRAGEANEGLLDLLRLVCYILINVPAPPLNDAHMGGFFMSGVCLATRPFQQTSPEST